MEYRIKDAQYREGYRVYLEFNDGVKGEADLRDKLRGRIFEPLHDVNYFRKFTVHPELETIVWENGADLSPASLREAVLRGKSESGAH